MAGYDSFALIGPFTFHCSLNVVTCNRKRLNLQSTPFSDRNYLQLNLQSNAPNLQSLGLNRHYLQLKIWTWTGSENDRLLDANLAATRSTSGGAR